MRAIRKQSLPLHGDRPNERLFKIIGYLGMQPRWLGHLLARHLHLHEAMSLAHRGCHCRFGRMSLAHLGCRLGQQIVSCLLRILNINFCVLATNTEVDVQNNEEDKRQSADQDDNQDEQDTFDQNDNDNHD